MLCVQRTGWGKSAVYFLATALLRETGAGPTLIVSPLLALMRNQIAAAERLGIRAHTVNSTNRDAWAEVRDLLEQRRRRPAADQPGAAQQPAVPRRDAAAVRRARRPAGDRRGALHQRLGPRLPPRLPPHPGHARAAARGRRGAVHDGDRQRPRGGGHHRAVGVGAPPALRTYRGPLGRRACASRSWTCPRRPTAWPGWRPSSPQLPGSGIVYTLTKRDADMVADLLNAHGVAAEAYSGEVDRATASRPRSGCCATSSSASSPRARWAWATTSPTSASSCTTRRPAR